eukprot:1366-Ditylum_brightwellii.AAC.1
MSESDPTNDDMSCDVLPTKDSQESLTLEGEVKLTQEDVLRGQPHECEKVSVLKHNNFGVLRLG